MPAVWDEIELRIKAGYPFLCLVTHEESRVAGRLASLAARMGSVFHVFSFKSGFAPALRDAPQNGPNANPLDLIASLPSPGIFLLPDFHRILGDPRAVRHFKDLRETLFRSRKTIVITSPVPAIPPELEKNFTVLDIPLPGVGELMHLFSSLCEDRRLSLSESLLESFGRSAAGLTMDQAQLVFLRMLLEPERVQAGDTSPIVEEKRRLIESEGMLQFMGRDTSLSDVGGQYRLKQWLSEREAAFEQRARQFGLPNPKGMLLLGVQGCGKSLSARAVAAHFKLPLVLFDLGAAFGANRSPEESVRRALKLLEALAPVVVWIDEIEKAFAGTQDGRSEAFMLRVLGHFLFWLQEKKAPVFVAATANQIESLPPELLRKGRFDEVFFVDLPGERERTEILGLHLKRRGVKLDEETIRHLSGLTRNFTGAELEQVVIDGLFKAFGRQSPLTLTDLEKAIGETVPLYNTYEDQIKRLRDWARDRARPASLDTSLTDYFQKESC